MPPADPRMAASDTRRLAILREPARKVLWLSTWTLHRANHLRPSRDRLGDAILEATACIERRGPSRAALRRR